MKKNIKRIIAICLVFLEVIVIGGNPAILLAADVIKTDPLTNLVGGILGSKGSASPNANGMLSQMEKRYHLDKDTIQGAGESFNVSSQKMPAPEVDIFFSPSNPKFGEEVTATAMPKYFQEGTENMFFTWYIKHAGCEDGLVEGEDGWKDSCDVNNDGEINTSDWKVEAMRLVASNGFVTEKADYSSDSDSDGYKAQRGGKGNVQSNDYCYVHDFSSGKNYEIATADASDNDSEDGFDCVNDDGTDGQVMCTSPYTLSCGILEGSNDVDGYNVTGSGSTVDNPTGGTTTTTSLSTATHSESFSGTDITNVEAVTDSGYAPECLPDETCPSDNTNCSDDQKINKVSCPEGTTARCIKSEDADLIDPSCESIAMGEAGSPNFTTADITVDAGGTHPSSLACYDDGRALARFDAPGQDLCGVDKNCTVTLNYTDDENVAQTASWGPFTNPGDSGDCEASNPGCSGRYADGAFLWKAESESDGNLVILFPQDVSSGCGFSDPGEKDFACTTTTYNSDDVNLVCEHQFPKVVGMEVGDGSFLAREEEFWQTDPTNASTAGNGNNDEANVAGLGVNKLTWSFVPGDQVGVIVEGLSYLGTKHDDASSGISFALVNNIFHKEGDVSASGNPLCQIIKQEKYTENVKGYDVEIPFAKVDIHDCLKWNLVAPNDGDAADNMEVSLDYSPENPSVGSLGKSSSTDDTTSGDTLTVSATTGDTSVDTTQIYYKWSIYGFEGEREDLTLDQDDWTELSSDTAFRSTNNIKLLEGLGMDEFEMQLNTMKSNNKTYDFLRFYVETEEFFDSGTDDTDDNTTRSGRANVMIEPSTSTGESLRISAGSTSICDSGGSCEVLENQMIKVTLPETANVSNYSWTLDGEEIYNDGESSDSTSTKQGNTVSFVLQGSPGDYHTLNLVANDTTSPGESGGNTGEKLTLSKKFVVTKPLVGIGPNNEINRGESCKDLNNQEVDALGTYKTLAEDADMVQEVSDCSETVFKGSGTVTLTPTYYPSWISSKLKNVKYSVNGKEQTGCNATSCSIDLSEFQVGSTATISYEAEYWEDDATRISLKQWGVSEGDSSGKKISDSILVKISDNQTASGKASKIIAGLAYNIPLQMIFMFRMILIAIIIIFSSGILMSFDRRKVN
ncbi:MAG: hypothetical protein WAV16_01905 [Candidatus Moraniibacteriota bacterium]